LFSRQSLRANITTSAADNAIFSNTRAAAFNSDCSLGISSRRVRKSPIFSESVLRLSASHRIGDESYPLYVKEHTGHEPPIGEVLEQCIINTLSGDPISSSGSHASLAQNWLVNRE